MSRPTPETDAARHDLSDYGSPVLCSWGDWVEADFARKLERERDEAIDKYQSLQKTFEEWQLKFLSEQAELLHNKDVERDKLFDEAYQIRIERDEARSKLSLNQQTLTIAEGTLSDLRKQRDGWSAMCSRYKQERDEAREDAERWESSSDAMERAGAEQARRADENREWALKAERERDEAREKAERYRLEANAMMMQRDEWAAMCGRYKQERDEVKEKYRCAVIHWQIGAAKMERERDEWKNKAYSHATDYTLMEAKCFRLEQQLKEYDKLKS